MFVVAQGIILKSVLFKNLMQAFAMQKYMRAVDQKHNYPLNLTNLTS